jgi:tRNA pseudouridine55 synthase
MTRSADRAAALHGILLVDKPEGLSSAQVVARVKRIVGAAKVGHLGTLDPFATGLLPICLGEGTKLARFLASDDKRYTGEIVLGSETDTLDRTGTVVATAAVPALTPRPLADALTALRATTTQTPPMYSAIKRAGVPLYRLARAGQQVERATRAMRLVAFDAAIVGCDRLAFAVHCSKGTYVRVLASDLGRALGTVAHLASLRRTGFGPFDVSAALTLDALAAGACAVIAPSAALAAYRAVVADDHTVAALRQGRQHALASLGEPRSTSEVVRIESSSGDLVAVAEAADAPPHWRLARVLAP